MQQSRVPALGEARIPREGSASGQDRLSNDGALWVSQLQRGQAPISAPTSWSCRGPGSTIRRTKGGTRSTPSSTASASAPTTGIGSSTATERVCARNGVKPWEGLGSPDHRESGQPGEHVDDPPRDRWLPAGRRRRRAAGDQVGSGSTTSLTRTLRSIPGSNRFDLASRPPRTRRFPSGGGIAPWRGAFAPSGGGVRPWRGGALPSRGAFPPWRGGFPPSRGAVAPWRGAVPPSRGRSLPSPGGNAPSGGGIGSRRPGGGSRGCDPEVGGL
jgi:hypothetical protein